MHWQRIQRCVQPAAPVWGVVAGNTHAEDIGFIGSWLENYSLDNYTGNKVWLAVQYCMETLDNYK
jgi:hypothetical protein